MPLTDTPRLYHLAFTIKEATMKTLLTAAVTAVALLAGAGCSVTRDQQSVGSYIDDTSITTKVKAKFAEDKTVSAMAIQVETLKGTVQLSGFAKSLDEKTGRRTPCAQREWRGRRQERHRRARLTQAFGCTTTARESRAVFVGCSCGLHTIGARWRMGIEC